MRSGTARSCLVLLDGPVPPRAGFRAGGEAAARRGPPGRPAFRRAPALREWDRAASPACHAKLVRGRPGRESAEARAIRDRARFGPLLPPYEHYTEEIAPWTREGGRILINMTPGTKSNTDYMTDADPRFVPAARIVASILSAERTDPDGLNGYLLLMHLGGRSGREITCTRSSASCSTSLSGVGIGSRGSMSC